MLVIRLARVGRKKLAQYRIVAADSRRAATGKYVANLGHYDPYTKAAVIKKEDLEAYIKKGAQPSGAVIKLLKKQNIAVPKWAEGNLVVRNRKPKVKKNAGDEDAAKPAVAAADGAGDKAKKEEPAPAPEEKAKDEPPKEEKSEAAPEKPEAKS